MTPGRMTKALQRLLMITWCDQPSQSDIEALEANVGRVGLVIRLRWAIVAAIAIFSLVTIGIYATDGHIVADLWRQMLVPAVALVLVLVYNAFYQRRYREFANVAVFNLAQLLLDIAVVTLLIYYSGGVYSWFDGILFLFVLEGALILPTKRQVWLIAAAAAGAYVAVLGLVYFNFLPHMQMPFVTNDLQTMGTYVIVRALWTITVLAVTATVGTLFMSESQERVRRLTSQSVRDARTGLYDRGFLRGALAVELERSRRFDQGVSVMLADIDHFAQFNALFGVDAGNRMIQLVAEALRGVSGCSGDGPCIVVTARYSGEEFALLVPEDDSGGSANGEAMAEAFRARVAEIRDDDRSVTVSVGVAVYPRDGRTASELLGAADAALVRATDEGRNRVALGRGAAIGAE
jgi:diguanylate cyclase (GGDEF)-like protein